MRRIVIFMMLVCFICCYAIGQTKLSVQQQTEVLGKMEKASAAMKSMQCSFTQTKRMKLLKKDMVSKGVMYFKQNDKLRWQYTSPYDYVFILNGDKVSIKSAKSKKNIDVQKNKMFRQITGIILNSITGGGLRSASDFTVELYKSEKGFYAKLYPKKKELKQIYQHIEIHFNAALTMVECVVMAEKTGDSTQVTLSDVKTNAPIDEKLFAVD